MLLRILLILVALAFGGSSQSIADGLKPDSALYRQVKALDTKVFAAYNSCEQYRLTRVISYDHLSDRERQALRR